MLSEEVTLSFVSSAQSDSNSDIDLLRRRCLSVYDAALGGDYPGLADRATNRKSVSGGYMVARSKFLRRALWVLRATGPDSSAQGAAGKRVPLRAPQCFADIG